MKIGELALILALVLTCGVGSGHAQPNIDFAKLELQTVKVAKGLYVLMGGPAQGKTASRCTSTVRRS